MKKIRLISIIIILFQACISYANETENSTRFCVAVRGNGERFPAHMGALARSHEQYGMLWGIAGSSSGSIVSFIVDSIYGNPLLYDCDGSRCSTQETAARAALLLKSEIGRSTALSEFLEGTLFLVFSKIAPILEEYKFDQLHEKEPTKALALLQKIISDPSVKAVINPEILETLDKSENAAAVAKEIMNGIYLSSEFKVDTSTTFIRPGLASFPSQSEFLGKVGDFYALEGDFSDRSGMNDYFKACATPGRGKPWDEVKNLPAGESTCGQIYSQLISKYFYSAVAKGYLSTRLNKSIGLNLHTLVADALIDGPSAKRWHEARKAYLTGSPLVWAPEISDLKIGFFGNNGDLDLLETNRLQFSDIKTLKNYAVRNLTWRDVLNTSPAEPSVSRGVELPIGSGAISLGGWIELHPVQPLLNIGCQDVVLQTAEGSLVGGYIGKVLSLFNPTDAERSAFYSFSNPNSSVSQSLKLATGIKCIPYYDYESIDYEGLGNAGWNAPFLTNSPFFTAAKHPDPNIVKKLSQTGCGPGVGD